MKKQNYKKMKGQEPLLKSLVNKNIGSRTGKDVKAGKKITKDKDGYENFDDYWSESDADLTSNTTLHSISSRVSAGQEKENQSIHVTSSQPVGVKVNQLPGNQSVASCSQPVGAAACYLGYLTVGSRTGQNVIAGKNIRKHDDGFDNFDTYWSESEAESMLSFHKSLYNESKSFISASGQQDEGKESSAVTVESDSEVIINTKARSETSETSDAGDAATEDSQDRSEDVSQSEDPHSACDNVSDTGVEGTETDYSLRLEEVAETDDVDQSVDGSVRVSPTSQEDVTTHSAQSGCSEEESVEAEETGTVMRRPGSISVFRHQKELQPEKEILQECSSEGVTEITDQYKCDQSSLTKSQKSKMLQQNSYQSKDKSRHDSEICEETDLDKSRKTERSAKIKNSRKAEQSLLGKESNSASQISCNQSTNLSEQKSSDESYLNQSRNTRLSDHRSVVEGRKTRQSYQESGNESYLDQNRSSRKRQQSKSQSVISVDDESGDSQPRKTRSRSRGSTRETSLQTRRQSGRKSGKKERNRSRIEQEDDTADLTSARDMNISLKKSKSGKKEQTVKGSVISRKKSVTSNDEPVNESVRSRKKSVTSNDEPVNESVRSRKKSVTSNDESVEGAVQPRIKSAISDEETMKEPVQRTRKSDVEDTDYSVGKPKSNPKKTQNNKEVNRKSSEITEANTSTITTTVSEENEKSAGKGGECEEDMDNVTNINRVVVPLKVVKSNKKSLKTDNKNKQEQCIKNKSLNTHNQKNDKSVEDNDISKDTNDRSLVNCSESELTPNAEDSVSEAVEVEEGDNVCVPDEVPADTPQSVGQEEKTSASHVSEEQENQTAASHPTQAINCEVVQVGQEQQGETTPSDLIIRPPSGKAASTVCLNIGGDVTGSISKNTDITKTVSNTPMHSFRTKKRLSYSKLLDDSLEKEKQEKTVSDTTRNEDRVKPSALESLVEEKEEEDEAEVEEEVGSNSNFLSLRLSRREGPQQTMSDADSMDDNFWIVDEDVQEKPKKGRPPKKDGSGKSGNVSLGGKKKQTGEKRGRKKGVKKMSESDEGSPKKQARKSTTDVELSETNVQPKNSVKQRKSGKRPSGITRTPSSSRLKRTSADSIVITSAGKKSRSARVTKTREVMKSEKKSPQSHADGIGSMPVPRGRLSHLHLAGVGETPRSGVSFRQRRRRSLSESEKPVLNKTCPVDLSYSPVAEKEISRRISSIENSPANALTLTPCLVPQGSAKSVEKKKRRVTISNIVEKASVSYTDSSVSETGQAKSSSPSPSPQNCLAELSVVSYGDITGSPVHIFEMTNTDPPDPITAPPRSKIIYPKPGPDGLRRSKRVRCQPLEWYKNEHVIYENKSGDFVIAGVQPSREAEYIAAELEKKKRRAVRRLKKPKRPLMSRNKLIERQNLSMHQEPPEELDYTISSEMPVVNPNTQSEVLIDCVAPVDTAMYVGADGTAPREDDPYIICHALKQPRFTAGHLLIAPLCEKPMQLLAENTLIFTIVHGKLSVTIHRGSSILEAGDQFFVPRGNTYSVKNLRNEEAKLSFVNILENE